jgi:hypothetical protein
MSSRGRIGTGAALVVIAAWVAAYLATAWDGDLVALEELRERRVVYVEGAQVFLVAEGSKVLALSARSPGRDGRLLYCDSLQTFHGPHGEAFNRVGEYFAGPAPRDMDRYVVEISRGHVRIALSERIVAPGRSRTLSRPVDPSGRLCSQREGEPGFALPPGA